MTYVLYSVQFMQKKTNFHKNLTVFVFNLTVLNLLKLHFVRKYKDLTIVAFNLTILNRLH